MIAIYFIILPSENIMNINKKTNMKRLNLIMSYSAVLTMFFAFTACSQKKQYVDLGDLKTLEDSASYVFGIYEGMGMKAQGFEMNPEIFAKAYQQAYAGDTAGMMSQEQMKEVMQKYQAKMMEKQHANARQLAIPYRQAAEKFLESNKSAEGVITTESGLQYRVVKEGKGMKPSNPNDRVRIQYKLSLLDKDGKIGEALEDTFERGGEPVIFALNGGLIPGMIEVLKLMNAGSVFDVWIHPDLGYGDQNNPELPAGSLLQFRIEMIEVLPAKL
jgi:FKBP-type peptidyl-prolyl cis-trans isomerase